MKPLEVPAPITAAMGEPAFQAWRAKFQPRGLLKVIGWARAQETNSRFAAANASAEKLKQEIAKAVDGSVEKMRLEDDLVRIQKKVSEYSTLAQGAAAGTFSGHDSLLLLEKDLARFCADLLA